MNHAGHIYPIRTATAQVEWRLARLHALFCSHDSLIDSSLRSLHSRDLFPSTAVAETVRTFFELEARINALPSPGDGLVRVFRGQSHDYPLKPSGRRRKVPRADIWAHYLRRLVMYLEHQGVHEDLDSEFQLWQVWLQALAQHYGAGSNYLDVTHDLGIAVWFAFHTSKLAKLETIVGPVDETGSDFTLATTWVRLLPSEGPAHVYVFELKPWQREGIPDAGEVVDLQHAPELFQSRRIKAQSGCLIFADEDEDLKTRASHHFVLEGGFAESPYASWSLEHIFPAPAEDVWYARFLELPFLLTPEGNTAGGEPSLQQSLPITLYLSSRDAPYVSDIRARFKHLQPALVHPLLSNGEPAPGGWWSERALADAAPIVVEGPQISAHPPVEYPSWNHELLLSDWIDEVDTFDLQTNAAAGRTGLTNVLIEFSPLEEVDWNEAGAGGYLLRALWFLRNTTGELAAFFFLQDYPWSRFTRAGPILLRLGDHRRLEYRAPDDSRSWADIAKLERFGKAIVSGLVLLRDCSPIPKAAAYPQWEFGSEGGRTIYLPVSAGAVRLYRASGNKTARPWYVPRHPTGEPFTTAHPNVGTLKLEIPGSFADVTAAELQRHLPPLARTTV
jgi:hypothetical protein